MTEGVHVCGTGTWSGPKPGDPDNNSILTATPAFGGIDVAWSFPLLNPHAVAHTILYRSLVNDFSIATRRAVVDGSYFFDRLDAELALEYFYWIQIVSINGTYGEVIGPASAFPRPLIGELITQLTGKIDAGVLAQSLQASIDLITLNGQELFAEIAARIAAGDVQGASIQAVQTEVASALSYVNQEILQRTSADDVLVQQLNVLAASLDDATAAILIEQTLRIDADATLASQISTAQTTLNGQIASAQTTLQSNIDAVDGEVTSIGALYTAKVTVNGLIGGFGVYNDGTEVQAGFDVDTFWIGRTAANKRKPFIVQGDEVFIDNAVINQLTADRIDSRGLSIKDLAGNVILAAGTALDWGMIGGAGKAANNATVGATFGTNISGQITAGNVSTFIANAALGAAQIGSINLVGNFNVKSATAGARMEMDANAIKVFDASGVKRVQLGNLLA